MPVAPRNPVTRWTCLRCGWSTLVHERSDCLTVPRPRCRHELLQAARRAGELGEHEVGGVGEVGDGVEQGAVEVEQHRARREARVHPHACTAASSARSAPRIES